MEVGPAGTALTEAGRRALADRLSAALDRLDVQP